jgi:hypothetical protein
VNFSIKRLLLWLEEHAVGILMTTAVHLLIIMAVLILKVHAYTKRDYQIVVDLTQINQEEVALQEQQETTHAFMQKMNEEYSVRNIPVNTAEKHAVENISKMVQDIKSEMNITDPPPAQPEDIARQEQELHENEARVYDEKYPENAAGERTVYKGPTTVSYELNGRRHTWMPTPVYKCQGQGKIVIDIVVNPQGYVLVAEINKAGSDSQDPCLTAAAKRDAERSRFNHSSSSPSKQQGTISYMFMAQ